MPPLEAIGDIQRYLEKGRESWRQRFLERIMLTEIAVPLHRQSDKKVLIVRLWVAVAHYLLCKQRF